MRKISLSILLLFFTFTSGAKILMGPYLQAVTTNSVFVMVECDSRDTVWVDFGKLPVFGSHAASTIITATTAVPGTYVHKILLSELPSNSIVFYRARQGKSVSSGASFHTAVEQGTPFRLTWLADFRTNTAVHAKIAALAAKANSVASLYGGDLCINGEYHSWKKEFFLPEERSLIAKVPFFNATGNHEGNGQNTVAFLRNPESDSHSQQYYSFDYGDLHVLVLNTEVDDNPGSPQFKFAEKDLNSCTKPWKIVMSHAPAYCAGGHGEDTNMIQMTSLIFEPNHVDLVLSGHSHFYQHNLVNGIHHLVIGSAGAPLYTPKKASYTLVSLKDYNWATLDVSPSALKLVVYNAENKKLDELSLHK